MNDKLIKLANYCARSKYDDSMTVDEHKEKISLAEELAEEGVMYLDEKGCYQFNSEKDSEYFVNTIKNYNEKRP